MGVLYAVFPLDVKTRAALAEFDVGGLPDEDGRDPTPEEVRKTLAELSQYRVEYETPSIRDGSWGAAVEFAAAPVEGPWTHLRARNYVAENQPIKLGFEKGWPVLVVLIVAKLAEMCGALVIIPDTGEVPLVVPTGSDPEKLLRTWEHTAAEEM